MKTFPVPVRLDKPLQDALREGARRTPHKKQELIRMTLRRHLRAVIEQEAWSRRPDRSPTSNHGPEAVIARATSAWEQSGTRSKKRPRAPKAQV